MAAFEENEQAVDADFDEIVDSDEYELVVAKEELAAATGSEKQLTQEEMIKAVTAAAREGVISSSKKAKYLRDMGIFQSEFTKKKISKSTKVNKRKAAKKARRKNRK